MMFSLFLFSAIAAALSPEERELNITVYTSAFIQDNEVLIRVINSTDESQEFASGTGNITANLTANNNYTLILAKTISYQSFTAKIVNINLTENLSIISQVVDAYSGQESSLAKAATPVFAFNDTGLIYGYAELTIPNNGHTINKILHCSDWNYAAGSCSDSANWTVNAATEYGVQQNSTHFWFNATGFDGFGGGSVYLDVSFVSPEVFVMTDVVQNQTFAVNATVYCRGGNCGEVNGTIRYNLSSVNPDTAVSTAEGGTPFYIAESPAYSAKACSEKPLVQDAFCNITWAINATGAQNSAWALGALFASNDTSILSNHTSNATVKIVNCISDMTVHFGSIDFGSVLNTQKNNATGNAGSLYNITINSGSCNTDIYIKSAGLANATLGYNIGAGNMTFGNTTNEYAASFGLSDEYQVIRADIAPVQNVTTYYWLDVPPSLAGGYSGIITIGGVRNGESI